MIASRAGGRWPCGKGGTTRAERPRPLPTCLGPVTPPVAVANRPCPAPLHVPNLQSQLCYGTRSTHKWSRGWKCSAADSSVPAT